MEMWGTASDDAAAATPTIKIRGSAMMMISARAAAIFMEAGGMSGREKGRV